MHNETDWKRRYSRHLILPQFGEAAQRKLADARVLVVGAGGLGCASLPYLCASGVGHVGIIDPDKVELSNLPRQILFEEGDIDRPKVNAARDTLSERNNACNITTHASALAAENAQEIISQYDIVLDGCDHFETRFTVNRTCHALGIPLISAAAIGWEGQLMLFDYQPDSPCYQCFVPTPPADADTCSETGVVSPLCGIIGAAQALEALKYMAGIGEPLRGRIARFDALTHRWRESQLTADAACPCCGGKQ